MWHPSRQCSECGEHLPRARRPVNPGLDPFHLNFTAFGELGTVMGPVFRVVFGCQIPVGQKVVWGPPALGTPQWGVKWGVHILFCQRPGAAWGFGEQLLILFRGQQNAFPLPFPLGAWDEGDRHTQPPLLWS